MSIPEKEIARRVADLMLDRRSFDPDDDIAVLARQFIRVREREDYLLTLIAELRNAVKDHPDFQSREKFLDLGMRVAKVLDD